MSLLRAYLSAPRRHWDVFADRLHLRALPALPTIAIVLALAVALPLKARMNDRPTELAPTLAAERLDRYARERPEQEPELGPTGAIVAVRPAYYWPAQPGAQRYRFQVDRADGTPWVTPTEVETNHFLHDPAGGVQPGDSYTFTVEALDNDRNVVRTWQASFSVRNEPKALRELRKEAARELNPFERDLVLLGYYAEKALDADAAATPHDVTAAFLAARDAAGADFRDRMLALPHGPAYAAWLDAQLRRFGLPTN